MSRIDELIDDLCPDGVRVVPLAEMCDIFNGHAFKSSLFNTSGQGLPLIRIRDINSGFSGTYYSGEFDPKYLVNTGDLLIGMDGDFVPTRWRHGEALLNQRVCRVQNFSAGVEPGFVFFLLTVHLRKLQAAIQGSTVAHLSSNDLLKSKFPLPPLEVQQEIVRILDTFTELEVELEVELESRKKQYEHYRNMLLSFPDGDVRWVPIAELFDLRNGYTPSKANPEYWEDGAISWFRMEDIRTNGKILNDSLMKISKSAVKGDLFPANSILLTTSATIGEHALINIPHIANQRFTSLTVKSKFSDSVSIDFLYQYFFIVDKWCLENTITSSFASVDMSRLRKLEIPLPPLSKQKEIAVCLRNFEKLTSGVHESLPAEISARRKQYEYYRDKLLTFKELDQ